jgi:carboxymethylenebutenolidase
VIETALEIKTADGVCDAVLFAPSADEQFPGVLVQPDAGGIRDATKAWCARIAADGFAVLLVNTFYRTGKYPLFDPALTGDARMKRFYELAGPLTPEAIERDVVTQVKFLTQQKVVSAGALGVTGYCFGGAVALRTAAAWADKVLAVSSFHGGRLYQDTPTSPHLLLPRVPKNAHLYFAHASNDQSMPAEAIAKFEGALAEWGGTYESEVYPAKHGWTMAGSEVYDAAQSERAFEKLRASLRTLR